MASLFLSSPVHCFQPKNPGSRARKRTNSATSLALPLRASLCTLDLSLSFEDDFVVDDMAGGAVSIE